jgi:hypothetical protein
MSQVSTWGGPSFIEEVASAGGGGGTAPTVSGSTSIATTVARITRSNNVTAYSTGQVWGAPADARWSFVVPALPANSRGPYFTGIQASAVWGTSVATGMALQMLLFLSQPATVVADGAANALSSADIALMPSASYNPGSGPVLTFPAVTPGVANLLNQGAGLNGRIASASVSVPQANAAMMPYITPGQTMWGYLVSNGAYTPIAQETMDIRLLFTVTNGVSV